MNINIKATNMELTQAIKDFAHDKISAMEKFISAREKDGALAKVEVGLISKHHHSGNIFRAEIQLDIPSKRGGVFRAVVEDFDLYVAIDKARDEIKSEIERNQGKRKSLFLRGAQKLKGLFRSHY
jgi:ribosomal subunit interface protein